MLQNLKEQKWVNSVVFTLTAKKNPKETDAVGLEQNSADHSSILGKNKVTFQ